MLIHGNKQQKYLKISIISMFATLALVVVIVILNLLNGSVTVSGQYPGSEKTYSLTCNSSTWDYPIFNYINTNKKEVKIIAIFDNENMLHRISLLYVLTYDNSSTAKHSRDVNHAAQNLSYADRGLNADALLASYYTNDGIFQFNISANSDEINGNTDIYFSLGDILDGNYTKETVERAYTSQGFNCIESN